MVVVAVVVVVVVFAVASCRVKNVFSSSYHDPVNKKKDELYTLWQ